MYHFVTFEHLPLFPGVVPFMRISNKKTLQSDPPHTHYVETGQALAAD